MEVGCWASIQIINPILLRILIVLFRVLIKFCEFFFVSCISVLGFSCRVST